MFRWLFRRRDNGSASPVVDPKFNGPWPLSLVHDGEAAPYFTIGKINGNLVRFLLRWRKLSHAKTVRDVGFDWITARFDGSRMTFKTTGFDDTYEVFEVEPSGKSLVEKLHGQLLKSGRFNLIE